MTYETRLIPSDMNRGYWYGTVFNLKENRVVWCSDLQKRKNWAKHQAQQKIKSLEESNNNEQT